MSDHISARFRMKEDVRIMAQEKRPYSENKRFDDFEPFEGARIKLIGSCDEPFRGHSHDCALEIVIGDPEAVKLFRDAKIGQMYDLTISLANEWE